MKKENQTKAIYTLGTITVALALIGYYNFIQLNVWYWLLAPILIILYGYYTISYLINLFYTDSVKKTSQLKTFEKPTVDIYLPVCGESIEIIKKTFHGVSVLAKTYGNDKVKVYVGDDKPNNEVKNLAFEYGFKYLTRSNNEMKKTGNLKNLFENSNGKYYLVFDADFVPLDNFLDETISILENSPQIGILQIPQSFFYNFDNQFENKCSETQADFYNIIQQARNHFGASICVGSNAIFRRSAVEKTKLFDWLYENKIDHGEDANSGFHLVNNGYKVEYINKQLAFGRSAENLNQLIKQRDRWCSSSTKMFLTGIVAKSKLTLMQKICYYCGFLYYASDLIKLILNYLIIFIFIFHSNSLNWVYSLWFIPHIIFGMIIIPIFTKRGFSLESYKINLALTYTNAYRFTLRLFGFGADWKPTGAVQKDKTVENIKDCVKINLAIYTVLVIGLIFGSKIDFTNLNHYTLIFWIVFFVFNHILLIKDFKK